VNNILTRSVTGLVFVLVIVGSVIANAWMFALLFLFVSTLTQLEFYQHIFKGTQKAQIYAGLGSGIFLYTSLAASALGMAGVTGVNLIVLNFIPLVLVFVLALFSGSSNPFSDIGLTLTGILYIALPFGLLNYFYLPSLFLNEVNYGVLLGFFLILWLNDTAAYLVGSAIGKHHLFARISPKKTWEGSIGGALFALIAAWLLSDYFEVLVLWQWLAIALIIVVFGTLGDLVESMLKRSLGIKDSGNILPGHGGLLDRFDAVLLSAPVVFVFIAVFI
jgi:phosphatidate cytidylyltransferase